MTPPSNPQPSQPSSSANPPPSQQQPQLKTRLGRRTEVVLMNIWEPLDLMGKALMGDLWTTTYLSVQDAIALSILLQVPGLIGQWIIGKSFSDFSVCLQESALGPTRYACFIIVASDFLLWIVLAGRIIGRFWVDLRELRKSKGGGGHGSGQP
ncbi:hypothetical protein H6S82_23815 [Planktothrix sp. FACHB-1355]|uniref:Uncharacterized protein n=1 Tax=Aerosakkonema funiforme FACHB-1375 TaxID=2949571 RepID=A0A926VLK6_9CYAN|nr:MULTISPECIES: hypothetical protein [Oscillatoriales]MBD2186000.1 hypothetical protein [Aerosakkonema funiforme FACHB-1375]MBD3561848.1 hypothetical protein [Planktothrix sp. FACHB-1355]